MTHVTPNEAKQVEDARNLRDGLVDHFKVEGMTEIAERLARGETVNKGEAGILSSYTKKHAINAWMGVQAAYMTCAWKALFYPNWDAYVFGELSGGLQPPRETRDEATRSMRRAGMPVAAIASSFGVSTSTVERQIRKEGIKPDGKVLDSAGRQRDPKAMAAHGNISPRQNEGETRAVGSETPNYMASLGRDIRNELDRIERKASRGDAETRIRILEILKDV